MNTKRDLSFLFITICIFIHFTFWVSCSIPNTENNIENIDSTVFFLNAKFESTLEVSSDYIRDIIETRIPEERYKVMETELYSSVLFPRFYINNSFSPFWIHHYDSTEKVIQMVNFIENIQYHGFNPEHYHYKELKALIVEWEADSSLIFDYRFLSNLDMLLTDAFFISASHLYHGKVDPESLTAQWGIQRNKPELKLDTLLKTFLHTDGLEKLYKRFYPPHPGYEAMCREAERLSSVAEYDLKIRYDVKNLPVKLNDSSEIMPSIKKKLELLGFIKADTLPYNTLYDDSTFDAMRQFQSRFGFKPDGVIGKNTIEALATPIYTLIGRLYVNMERLRWLPDSLEKRIIMVNIADNALYVHQGKDTLLKMQTIVGKTYRKTPVFNALMTYLVFSPSWTVPPGIMRNDVIPSVIKNPDYLTQKNMLVYDALGNKIDPATINWKTQGRKYTVRQAPGRQNSLGKVKFMFPNKHNVYLHDTPDKQLFNRESHAFSSGCIRVKEPFELVRVLLDDMSEWTEESISEAMNSGKERTVVLKTPVGVYIYYLTAWGGVAGEINYRNDIYKNDELLLQALKQKKQETLAIK